MKRSERLDGALLIIGLDFRIARAGDLGEFVGRDRHGELNQIFAAPFPVCRHSLSTRRHGDSMIEIVVGDHLPDLPFVIVDRQAATSISPGSGSFGTNHGIATIVTPLHWPRGNEHVGDEEADGLLIMVGACGAFVAPGA
jgi:hypothetical protein